MASPYTTPSSVLDRAVGLLSPAVGILDSFAHRNKNQHRLSKWWAQFDMLRRNARRLVADLQVCLDARAKSGSTTTASNKKKKNAAAVTDARGGRDGDAPTQKMEARARFVAGQIVPRAFLAFTQLAADNQYAHLGLALVGVLAQVHAAVALLVPLAATPADEGVRDGLDVVARGTGAPQTVREDGADLGVAISRSEVVERGSVPADKPKAQQQVEDLSLTPSARTAGEGPSEEEKAINRQSEEKPERPKKSKKGRDEFDSLFDSLETEKPVKKKKKKRKKGDEFDDLFSSLV